MDVREQWTDRVTERRSSVAVPPAGNPNFTIRLLFRARLFFSKDMALASLSAGGLHLLYIQAVHDVVHGDYACPPKEAVSLCALQVQAEHEDAKIEYADILRYCDGGAYHVRGVAHMPSCMHSDNLLKLHFSKQMVHQYKGSETHLRQLVGQEREKLRGEKRFLRGLRCACAAVVEPISCAENFTRTRTHIHVYSHTFIRTYAQLHCNRSCRISL